MPRTPRRLLVDEGSINRCCLRIRNAEPLFSDRRVSLKLLELLRRYKGRHGVLIHAYCVVGDRAVMITTATLGQRQFSKFWQCVNQALAKYCNRLRGARGQVVMERLRSPRLAADAGQLLIEMTSVEEEAVREGAVERAEDWRYSSGRHRALGVADELVDGLVNPGGRAVQAPSCRVGPPRCEADCRGRLTGPVLCLGPLFSRGCWWAGGAGEARAESRAPE